MVRRHSAWRKNNRRELRHTLGRFLAIFAIIALGVGFFTGIKLAQPAMMDLCRDYLDRAKFYDYMLLSTLGLTEGDRAYFADLPGIQAAEGSVSADLLTTVRGQQAVLATHQLLEEINRPTLTAGRLPEGPDEVLGDDLYFREADLGTVLPVENGDDSAFSRASYTLVGLCHTPQYLNIQRGTTSLGSGSVAGFLYLPAEGYDLDVYTEVYLRLEAPGTAYSEDYENTVGQWKAPLEDALAARGAIRKDQVVRDAEEALGEARAKYSDGLKEYEEARADTDRQLSDAKKELDDAAQKLADGEKALAEGEETLQALEADPYSNEELAKARKDLDDGWAELQAGETRYAEGKKAFDDAYAAAKPQLDDAKKQLDDAKQQLDEGQRQYDAGLAEFAKGQAQANRQMSMVRAPVDEAAKQVRSAEETLRERQQALEALERDENADPLAVAEARLQVEGARAQLSAARSVYEAALEAYRAVESQAQEKLAEGEEQLRAGKAELDDGRAQYEDGLRQYEENVKKLEDGRKELQSAAAQLDSGRRKLEDGEQALQKGYADALAQGREALADAEKELADGKKQYDDGVKEYEDGVREAEEKFAEAKAELDDGAYQLADAQAQVESLKTPSYYAMDRMTNTGYASFRNDTSIVAGVAKVFPVFFFLVAALVCSSTMTRMVEEQRTQNGSLKAMGYSDGMILWRYASYAGGAGLLGALIGLLVGSWLFPTVIWDAYGMLYHFGDITIHVDPVLSVIAVAVSLLCSVGAACLAAWSELRETPAELMRPKAPKAGKRIWLEYFKPLWKRLSFLQKVAARNVFRYKKRLFMMVLGVGGCLALLLTGLGLRDSIANVARDQFGNITTYDLTVTYDKSDWDRTAPVEGLWINAGALSVDALTDRGTKQLTLIAADDPAITEVMHLRDWKTGEDLGYPTGDEAFLSRKLAELADLREGDVLTLQMEDSRQVEIPITHIYENYVNDFLFLTTGGFEAWCGEPAACKTAFVKTEGEVHAAAAALRNESGVVHVSVARDLEALVEDMMSSLNAVVGLVVACALALSFVVSYNLININITERVREIATIKVLGFYRGETYSYIFRESLVLTSIGIVAGIPMGLALHRFVMSQVQVDLVSFHVRIAPLSFLIALVLTFVIAGLVNLLLRGKIDRVNMAESLKSVE